MAYGLHDLELTGLQARTILSVKISHKPGEHGILELTADLGEVNGDFPVQLTESSQEMVLYEHREGKRNRLFCGIIVNLEVYSTGKSYYAKVKAYTNSYLMDIQKKSRSFQDTTMTLGTLASQIIREYGGESRVLFEDQEIGEIAVQYEETDWQFLKRILSARHIPLACSEVREDICIYLGTAQIPGNLQAISIEKVWKDISGAGYWRETGERIPDGAFITYQLKLDNHIPLYSFVSFRERELTVSAIEYQTIGSFLYEFVMLQKGNGILQEEIYPMELVGSALEGTVLDVKGEKIQIHLAIDDLYQGNDCYWFPFSTPSASSDGSGWYCMPERGDKVRIYFPSKKTGDVIAISAVSTYTPTSSIPIAGNQGAGDSQGTKNRVGSGEYSRNSQGAGGYSNDTADNGANSGGGEGYSGINSGMGGSAGNAAVGAMAAPPKSQEAKPEKKSKDKMGDPATKYLRVPSGQEIKLAPEGIKILCSNGSVKIEILKSGKINIYAKENIRITAKNSARLKAKYAITAGCQKTASLKSVKGGSLLMDNTGKLVFKGTDVHVN